MKTEKFEVNGYITAADYAKRNATSLYVMLYLIHRNEIPAIKHYGKWYVKEDMLYPLSVNESNLLMKYLSEENLKGKNGYKHIIHIKGSQKIIDQYFSRDYLGEGYNIYFDPGIKKYRIGTTKNSDSELNLSAEILESMKKLDEKTLLQFARYHVAARNYNSYRIVTVNNGSAKTKNFNSLPEALQAAEEFRQKMTDGEKMFITYRGKNIKEF